MKDRIPKYPGRVTLTPVEGQANTFDMIRADEPEQEGTPLNKKTLLTDETASLFGLGEDATVDGVLKKTQKNLPVGTVIRSSQSDAAEKLGGSWALCNGSVVPSKDAPELYANDGGLTKYTRAFDGGGYFNLAKANPTGWERVLGQGAYGEGYYVVPAKYTATKALGLLYAESALDAWQVISFADLSAFVWPSYGSVSYCDGRWFVMYWSGANGSCDPHVLTSTSLHGGWTDITLPYPESGGAWYSYGSGLAQCSRVLEYEDSYIFMFVAQKSSTTKPRGYLAKIDKETLEPSVIDAVSYSSATTNGVKYLTGVDLIDGTLYVTTYGIQNNLVVIWKVDVPTGTATKLYSAGTGNTLPMLTNVVKCGDLYVALYVPSTTAHGNSTSRSWYRLSSTDGVTFDYTDSTAFQITCYADSYELVEIDGQLFFYIDGVLHPYDVDTNTVSSAAYSSITNTMLNVPFVVSTSVPRALLVAPDEIFVATSNSVDYVQLDAVKLPSISEENVYDYIKIKE